MQWTGYTPYEDFIRRLAMTNPARLPKEASKTQQFNVETVSKPFMNNPAHSSSTFIKRIVYMPDSSQVLVTLGNSKYVYPMSRTQLARWMTSDSLGQHYNRYIKLK